MKKRSESEWRQLFSDHATSGLSAAAYCREHNLCPKYFSLRRRQLGAVSSIDNVKKAASNFIKVEPPALLPSLIQLEQGDLLLSIPSNVSAQWLASLVVQLR